MALFRSFLAAGGELFLMKRINRARYEQLRDRFGKQEFLAMMIPSILPPPTPWKLFVFAAGVFEMKTVHFMLGVRRPVYSLHRYGTVDDRIRPANREHGHCPDHQAPNRPCDRGISPVGPVFVYWP